MTVARSAGVLIGTAEGNGVSLASGSSSTSSETDFLGNDTSAGEVNLYIGWTFPNSAPTAGGTIDISFYASRVSSQAYSSNVALVGSVLAVQNTTILYWINGATMRFPIARRMTCSVKNNTTGQTITNLFVGYELFAFS